MSDEKKTEEVREEAAEAETEEEKAEEKKAEEKKAEEPKEEKKERKGKAKEEKAEAKEEKKAESPQGASDAYLRLLAEYDNYRKRSQKEKDSLYADIKADTVTKFLPVYCQTLEKLGVTKTESLGQKFDPKFHNAVMHVDDEEKGENEIVEVFQEGFMLGEKVIRFAMVKVAN